MQIGLREGFARQKPLVAFNFFNWEPLPGIFQAAQQRGKVVILAVGERYIPHLPLAVAAAMAKSCGEQYPAVDYVLHLDHGETPEVVRQAVDLGFSSVMYDGSRLPLEENIQNTAALVDYAHGRGACVEGELGCLNKEDGSDAVAVDYTPVEDCRIYVSRTGVDALAVAVGNAHGLYRETPHINQQRLKEIAAAVPCPLVLHGSSGIPVQVLREAFANGVGKINVNTELQMAASAGVARRLEKDAKARFESLLFPVPAETRDAALPFLEL